MSVVRVYTRVILESLATMLFPARSSNECPKCGISKKSDKYSCCARGGAWFQNCGDAGDNKFDHTWVEGIQACKDYESSLLVNSPLQTVDLPLLNITQLRNVNQQQIRIINRGDSISNAGITESQDHFGLTKVVVCVCAWFVLLHHL